MFMAGPAAATSTMSRRGHRTRLNTHALSNCAR
jgi:hypothetical protein